LRRSSEPATAPKPALERMAFSAAQTVDWSTSTRPPGCTRMPFQRICWAVSTLPLLIRKVHPGLTMISDPGCMVSPAPPRMNRPTFTVKVPVMSAAPEKVLPEAKPKPLVVWLVQKTVGGATGQTWARVIVTDHSMVSSASRRRGGYYV
jgi:hypothetical protein